MPHEAGPSSDIFSHPHDDFFSAGEILTERLKNHPEKVIAHTSPERTAKRWPALLGSCEFVR